MMKVTLLCLVLYLFSIEAYMSAFILTTSSDRATAGLEFSFTCAFTYDDYVGIRRVGKYECIMDVNNGTCSLILSNPNYTCICNDNTIILSIPGTYDIDILHGTIWKCDGLLRGGVSNTVSLYVNVLITNVNLTAMSNDINPVEIVSSSSQYFICTTDAGRPSSRIQWYLSTSNITDASTAQPDICNFDCNGKVISSSVLVYIGNITDTGKTIHCTADNLNGEGVKSQDRYIDILHEPIISDIQDHNITEGSNLMIIPNIDANPDPISVWWTRRHETGFVYYGTNLTIRSIEREFSDNFTCHVMNTITKPGDPMQNRTTEGIFRINVQYPPSVYIKPSYSPFIVQEGQQNVRLSCEVDGANPSNEIIYQWTYHVGTTRDRALFISPVLKGHTGMYSCTAKNAVGTSKRTRKEIDVQYEPVISEFPDYNIAVGKTLTVTPTIDANPLPLSIWWTRQNNGSFIYNGTTLTIINIQKTASDNYTCHAMNTLTPSGLPASNRTAVKMLHIYVQMLPNNESKNDAVVGIVTGVAVIIITIGLTSVLVLMYRKSRMPKRKEINHSGVYESGSEEPRQTPHMQTDKHFYNELQNFKTDAKQQLNGPERRQTPHMQTDKHFYNELQNFKTDAKQQLNGPERSSNTYEEFCEVKSIKAEKIYENMKISDNEMQKSLKETALYVNMELKPSTES